MIYRAREMWICFECIFVDDDSENTLNWKKKIEQFLLNFPWKLLFLPKKEKVCNRVTISRNYAVRHSKGDILLFVDQDIIFHVNYGLLLQRMLKKFPDLIIAGSFIWYNNLPKHISRMEIQKYIKNAHIFTDNFLDFRGENIIKRNVWKFFCASHSIVPRKIFQAIWWFDEQILSWGNEDVDLAFRIAQKKNNIYYIPQLQLLNLSEKLYGMDARMFTEENYEWLLKSWKYLLIKHDSLNFSQYTINRINHFPKNIIYKFFHEVKDIIFLAKQ